MAIRVDCPACGVHLSARDDDEGKVFACPQCKGRVVVPDPFAGLGEIAITPSSRVRRPQPVSRRKLLPLSVAFVVGLAAGTCLAIIILHESTPERVRTLEGELRQAQELALNAVIDQQRAESDRQRDLALLRDSNDALKAEMELSESRRELLLAALESLGMHFDSDGNLIVTGRPAPATGHQKGVIRIGGDD